MLITKTAVGTISRRADSAMPNMFTAASTTSPASDTSSTWCDSDGNMLPRLAAPAASDTATVRT